MLHKNSTLQKFYVAIIGKVRYDNEKEVQKKQKKG